MWGLRAAIALHLGVMKGLRKQVIVFHWFELPFYMSAAPFPDFNTMESRF
jgi:hypothetical protein